VNLNFSFVLVVENIVFGGEFEFYKINGVFNGRFIIYMLHFTKIAFQSVFITIKDGVFLIFFFLLRVGVGHADRFIDENKVSWSFYIGANCDR